MEARTHTARLLRQSATPAECHLWKYLRAHPLAGHAFKRQKPIGPYIVDFGCLRRRLIIEVDGNSHETKVEYDRIRTQYLQHLGYRVLRFPNDRVLAETKSVLRSILQHLSPRKP